MNTVLSLMFGAPREEEFSANYSCHSFALYDGPDPVRESLRLGGRLVLPQSAATSVLTAADVDADARSGGGGGCCPMTFRLVAIASGRSALAGVQEFTAPEGVALLPDWLMRRLGLADGGLARVSTSGAAADAAGGGLPRGQLARLRPLASSGPDDGDFLAEVADPRAALERHLRGFVCLSVGDELELRLRGRRYRLAVTELRPAPAVCVVDCDLSVEFGAAPVAAIDSSCQGQRQRRPQGRAGEPNFDYAWGSLSYPQHRRVESSATEAATAAEANFVAFSGPGSLVT